MSDILPINGETNIEAAARVNASRYRPVASNAVLEWMGKAGRRAKLRQFFEQTKASTDPQTMVANGAVDTVLQAASNSTSYLTLDPASEQVELLALLVGLNVLSQDDADALIAKAQTLPLITVNDVAAAITADALAQAASARLVSLETFVSSYRAAVNAAETIADLPEPITP